MPNFSFRTIRFNYLKVNRIRKRQHTALVTAGLWRLAQHFAALAAEAISANRFVSKVIASIALLLAPLHWIERNGINFLSRSTQNMHVVRWSPDAAPIILNALRVTHTKCLIKTNARPGPLWVNKCCNMRLTTITSPSSVNIYIQTFTYRAVRTRHGYFHASKRFFWSLHNSHPYSISTNK